MTPRQWDALRRDASDLSLLGMLLLGVVAAVAGLVDLAHNGLPDLTAVQWLAVLLIVALVAAFFIAGVRQAREAADLAEYLSARGHGARRWRS